MTVFTVKREQDLQEHLDVCVQVGHRGRGSTHQASLVVVECADNSRVFSIFHVDKLCKNAGKVTHVLQRCYLF